MRKLASIVEIEKVEPIADSDRLSVATMVGKGWNVVVGRGEFKPGDRACYLEIDSFLPADDERYSFLTDKCLRVLKAVDGTELDRGLRIKTIKLRGVISQGLIFDISKFPELSGSNVGDDVTEILHVRHFDEVCESYADKMTREKLSADAYGKFPIEIPKTDEERCLFSSTKLITKNGIKTIKDICNEVSNGEDIFVLSRNLATEKNEYKKVLCASVGEHNLEWYKIHLQNGKTLIATGNHKVFIPEIGVFRRIDKLKVGDFLLQKTDE